MTPNPDNFPENPNLEREAADWALKMDRGLSAEEQDQHSQWLAADPRHREAMALYRWGWSEFDRLAGLQTTDHSPPNPDLLAPGNRFTRRPWLIKAALVSLPLGAAFAVAALFVWQNRQGDETPFTSQAAIELIARIEQRALEDGSVVDLNRGAIVSVEYTPEIRRVVLSRGEANFDVAKDPSRPFVVNVAGIDVRAVGTQFNVRLTDKAVDVIVSEGRVAVVSTEKSVPNPEGAEPLVEMGQRAVVGLDPSIPQLDIVSITPDEIERELGWRPTLLDFDNEPLSEIVAEFNRRNTVQLVIGDEKLEELHLSNYFWSDNVEGFVRLMEKSFGMSARWNGSNEIILRKSRG